jgi:hypothetical protein
MRTNVAHALVLAATVVAGCAGAPVSDPGRPERVGDGDFDDARHSEHDDGDDDTAHVTP